MPITPACRRKLVLGHNILNDLLEVEPAPFLQRELALLPALLPRCCAVMLLLPPQPRALGPLTSRHSCPLQ